MNIEEAYQSFQHPDHLRAFMFEMVNETITPFVRYLSEVNDKDPRQNARELSNMTKNYLSRMYSVTKHFGAQDSKTYYDYLNDNKQSARLAFEYLITNLKNQYSQDQIYLIFCSILEPYISNPSQSGDIN